MFNIFAKKKEIKIIYVSTPMSGVVIALEAVPDPVFSGKMVGDGFAIEPTDGSVVAPVAGEIVQMFPTGHAFGIKTPEGLEVLVHVGIDTVQLKGVGFETFAKVGDQVTVGQMILNVDLEVLKAAGKSTVTPVVITNMTEVHQIKLIAQSELQKAPTQALEVILK